MVTDGEQTKPSFATYPLRALDALAAIGGKNPWWSLGVFALCIYILHGLIVFDRDVRASEAEY